MNINIYHFQTSEKINHRGEATILKPTILVLLLNEIGGVCRKMRNSESTDKIEFFAVHLSGEREQNDVSFWSDMCPFQLYLWMPLLSDFFWGGEGGGTGTGGICLLNELYCSLSREHVDCANCLCSPSKIGEKNVILY